MLERSEQSAEQHAREILALTKLNWNNSRLDGREPITMRAVRSIGTILRHVPSDRAVGLLHVSRGPPDQAPGALAPPTTTPHVCFP